jgi:cytochrome d ubiquinol oxidase subunit II
LQPYPILTGLFAVALFAMHGAIYLYLKTDGKLQKQIHGWMWTTFGLFLTLYILTTIFTLAGVPQSIRNFQHFNWAWGIVVLNVLAIANIPRTISLGQPGYAFLSSSFTIAALVFLFGLGVYPNLVAASPNGDYSLNIYNAASSPKTLAIMQLIAFLGMPFVLAYTTVIYWVFRGKVRLGHFSY